MNILTLVRMVNKKNELNLKRLRFHRYQVHVGKRYDSIKRDWNVKVEDKAINFAQAAIGYERSKEEMRAMTPEIRKACKQLGAKLCWKWGGWCVDEIRLSDGAIINVKNYMKHAQFESIVLG